MPIVAASRSISSSMKRRYGTGTAASHSTSGRLIPAGTPFNRLWKRWWWVFTQPG